MVWCVTILVAYNGMDMAESEKTKMSSGHFVGSTIIISYSEEE